MAGLRCINEPDLLALDTGEFSLKDDLIYEYVGTIKDINFRIVVPTGFVTDFATIPWYARVFINKTGPWNKASALHDWLYTSQGLSRSIADALFLEAMELHGVPLIKRHLMYLAVLLFANNVYKNGKTEYESKYPGFLKKHSKEN